MTESFDTEHDSDADTRKTKVKKHGRNSEIDEALDKALKQGIRHGRHKTRILGKTDITDIPSGLSQKIMPLPYSCIKCGKMHMAYRTQCVLCGWPTPLGLINWRR